MLYVLISKYYTANRSFLRHLGQYPRENQRTLRSVLRCIIWKKRTLQHCNSFMNCLIACFVLRFSRIDSTSSIPNRLLSESKSCFRLECPPACLPCLFSQSFILRWTKLEVRKPLPYAQYGIRDRNRKSVLLVLNPHNHHDPSLSHSGDDILFTGANFNDLPVKQWIKSVIGPSSCPSTTKDKNLCR